MTSANPKHVECVLPADLGLLGEDRNVSIVGTLYTEPDERWLLVDAVYVWDRDLSVRMSANLLRYIDQDTLEDLQRDCLDQLRMKNL